VRNTHRISTVESRYHDQRHAGIGAAEAAIEPHRDEPQHGNDQEHQHEALVLGGLALACGEPHALGQEAGIDLGKPQPAGRADQRRGDQVGPRAGPVQRACEGKQQRGHGEDEERILQEEFCDHGRLRDSGGDYRTVFPANIR
jgi:hypothetical protein